MLDFLRPSFFDTLTFQHLTQVIQVYLMGIFAGDTPFSGFVRAENHDVVDEDPTEGEVPPRYWVIVLCHVLGELDNPMGMTNAILLIWNRKVTILEYKFESDNPRIHLPLENSVRFSRMSFSTEWYLFSSKVSFSTVVTDVSKFSLTVV